MNKVPQISDAEWEIMKILWRKSPRTANEIIEELSGGISWKPKTVKTLISRLVNKKAVSYEKENRTYSYYPLVSENECVKTESKSFLKRVYGGALKPMFINFLEEQNLSPEEIDELKRILEKKNDK